jgi:hypothetical protein
MKKLLIVMVLCYTAYASTGAAYLDNGITARSDALGRSFTAMSDDLDAFYYNPAGFGFQKRPCVAAMGTRMNNLYNVYYAGYGMPLGKGYGAVNYLTTGVDSIPETKYESGKIIDTGNSFSYSARAIFVSYGIGLGAFSKDPELQKMTCGISLKHLSETLFRNHASGMGVDAGFLYRVDDSISVGFSVLNLIEPAVTWDTDSKNKDSVERVQKAGVAWRVTPRLVLTSDMTFRKNDSLSGFGLEYLLSDYFSLRGGAMTNTYALGFGLQYGLHLDYVYLISADQLIENTHKVSMAYVFGPVFAESKKTEAKSEIKTEPVIPTKSIEATPPPKQEELPEITVIKSSALVAEKKVKWFCRINNPGAPIAAKMTVIIRNADNKVLDQRSQEMTIASGESVIDQSLFVGTAKGAYDVRGYLKYGETLKETKDSIIL